MEIWFLTWNANVAQPAKKRPGDTLLHGSAGQSVLGWVA